MSKFEFKNYGEAYEEIAKFMDFYNKRRIHSSIQDLAPNEFYELLQKNEEAGI